MFTEICASHVQVTQWLSALLLLIYIGVKGELGC